MNPYEEMARRIAQEVGIDPDIFSRQIRQESSFNPKAISPKGARGLGQLMPDHWEGKFNPEDPETNLYYAANLMKSHLAQYGGNWRKALTAYNAGQGNLADFGGDENALIAYPNFVETKNYLQNILGGSPMAGPDEKPKKVDPIAQGVKGMEDKRLQANGLAPTPSTSNEVDQAGMPTYDQSLGSIGTGGLVNRAFLKGGWGKFFGLPQFKRMMQQAQQYISLRDMLGGGSTADFINGGGIQDAFNKNSVQNLYSMFLNSSRATDAAGYNKAVPGRGGFGGGQVDPITKQPIEGATSQSDWDAIGNINPARYALQSDPGILQALMSLQSYGNSEYGNLMQNYINDVVNANYSTDPYGITAQNGDILSWFENLFPQAGGGGYRVPGAPPPGTLPTGGGQPGAPNPGGNVPAAPSGPAGSQGPSGSTPENQVASRLDESQDYGRYGSTQNGQPTGPGGTPNINQLMMGLQGGMENGDQSSQYGASMPSMPPELMQLLSGYGGGQENQGSNDPFAWLQNLLGPMAQNSPQQQQGEQGQNNLMQMLQQFIQMMMQDNWNGGQLRR